VVSGGPATLAFVAGDQLLDFWQSYAEETNAPVLYGQIEVAGTGLEGAGLAFELAGDHLLSTATKPFSWTSAGVGAAQFLDGAAPAWAVTQTDWYVTKDLRAITSGTRGYCPDGACSWFFPGQIPPDMLSVFATRPDPLRGDDDYPATQVWTAAYRYVFAREATRVGSGAQDSYELVEPYDYHTKEPRPGGGSQYLAEWLEQRFVPYPTTATRYATIDASPDVQAVRITVPKSDLLQYGATDPAAGGIDAEDLLLRLQWSESQRELLKVSSLSPAPKGKDEGSFYAFVSWTTRSDASVEDLGPDWQGPDNAPNSPQVVQGPLRRRYTAYLFRSGAPEEEWLSVDIEFARKPGPHTHTGQADAPRVHETTARAERKAQPSEWVLKEVSFTAEGDFSDPYAAYQLGFWQRVVPDSCQLRAVPIYSSSERRYVGMTSHIDCVFASGCQTYDDCFSLLLAEKSDYVWGDLTVDRQKLDGWVCSSFESPGGECYMMTRLNASFESRWNIEGSVVQQWSLPRATGTMTLRFRGEPIWR